MSRRIQREEQVLIYLQKIKQSAIFVYPQRHVTLCEDPDDNMFLDTAIEGKADFVVSGDKKLLKIQKIEDTTIISPREFLTVIQE